MADKDGSEATRLASASNNATEKLADSTEGDKRDIIDQGLTLEQFIVDNYEQQKNEGRHEATGDISDERTANFYSRAIGESRRMCGEVEKSKQKLDKLHSELGGERLAAWRTEHASEVLLPEEAEKIALAEQIYA